ncbi:MAG TPA: MlaD family protein [Verrucomicrobiae bacterium]|nr:MlaD family protein [Verrucomicrobiae bacterium]
MAQRRSVEIKVGIFVAVCLVLMAWLIWKFGKYEPLSHNTYEITVVFSNVGGIVKDAAVLYGGIKVGSVREITLDQQGLLKVHVKLAIFNGVKIRSDAKFVINQSGLLGDRYVDVIPQSGTAPFLEPGALVQGSSSVDLTEAIRGVVGVLHQAAGTIERVDKAIQRIDETVLSRESLEHLEAALANIDATSSNAVGLTSSLRSVVEDSRGKVDNALTKFSAAADNFDRTTKDADTVVKNVNHLVTDNQEDIRTAVKNLAESTARLQDILARLEKGEGTAGKLLVDPTLHDEIVHLVQNWRKYGLLYKEGNRPPSTESQERRHGSRWQPARPAQGQSGTILFGTDETKSAK